MKVLRSLVLPAVASLVLFAGCNPENPVLPDPKGAEGYCQDGWDAYAAHDFGLALENFQAAIDVDVTYEEAYLGAGWASLNVSDYWILADDYFYMALQQDMGYAPITFTSGSLVQDTMWTVFECLDPDLPPEVLDPILAMTADSGAVWVGDQIFPLVYQAGSDTDPNIPYRFHVDAANVVAMITTFNNTSSYNCPIDSIVPDGEGDYWVYVMSDYTLVTVGEDDFRTWISVDNEMTFDYATFLPGTMTQVSYDALAGWVMLQHVRGINGDPLTANAASWALDRTLDSYVFGEGAYRRDNVDLGSIENLNLVQIKGMAAASSFDGKWSRTALFDCRSEGYAVGLAPGRPDFLMLLMQEIEEMIAFQG